MDTKEILWDSSRPKFGDGAIFGEIVSPVGPSVAIEEDLQRAITALREVPTFSWSGVNSLLEGQDQGSAAVASAEYVWKAEDFDWPYKDCRAPPHDRNNFDRFGDAPSASDAGGRSEIRTDSFTVLSKRIHLAPDKSCRMSDESTESSFRVCLSGQKKKKNPTDGSDSRDSQKMSKPPLPRHPLSSSSSSSSSRLNCDVPRRVAPAPPPKPPPPSADPPRLRNEVDGAAKTENGNGMKTQETETSDAVRGIFDFYERSLDILESEELKKRRGRGRKSEVSSPRSNSPETILEELLDSISADEYDTLSSESKNKNSTKRPLPSSSAKTQQIYAQTSSSSSPSSRSASAEQRKPCEAKTFMLTGFQNNLGGSCFESSELAKFSAREQNNNDVACYDQSTKHQTRGHSSTQPSKETPPPPPQVADVASIATHAQRRPATSTVHQDSRHSKQTMDDETTELTPEDIFEEIMESMEASGGKRKENLGSGGRLDMTGRDRQAFPNQRDARNAHSGGSVFGLSRDYGADSNGLLSVYYNRSRSGMQLCLREEKMMRKSRSEEDSAKIPPAHDKLATSPPLSRDIHPDSGKPSTKTPPSFLVSPSSSSISSSVSSSSFSSSFAAYPSPETRATSQRAQESIYCTVKQKPVPPLRQKATKPSLSSSSSLSCFAAKQHCLMYNVRQPPVSKQQQQQQQQKSSPSSEASCFSSSRGGETADHFEAECDALVDKRSDSVDQKVRALELLPKDPDRNLADGEEEEEKEENSSSVGVEEESRRQRLPLPDAKRNGSSLKGEEEEGEEEILFSRGFADDKDYGGCEEEEEGGGGGDEVDLDLDVEFSRNLDACTGSDVECPGVDKLMSESSIIAESKCTKQKMKSPRKLGILIGKKRLQKAPHAVDTSDDLPPTTSRDLLSPGSTRPSSYDRESETRPTWKPSQPTEPRSDQVGLCAQGTADRYVNVADDGGNFCGANRDVVSKNQELERDVGRLHETRILSEEVTSQELLLKIVWPKKDVTGLLLPCKTSPEKKMITRPPFRDLRLHRILRICDDDDPHPDPRQTDATHGGDPSRPGIGYQRDSPGRPEQEELAMEKPEQRTISCRRIEHVSGSPIAVNQRETVRVMRAPLANGHAVKNIKQVVDGVGYTIIQEFERSPVKRNIKVSCEATECKSQSAIRDGHQDVTIIRNTIIDTLRSNTTPALLHRGSSVSDERSDD